MVTPELSSYIQKQLSLGKTRDEISHSLIAGGNWKTEDIQEAFNVLPMSPSIKNKMSSKLIVGIVIATLIVISSLFQGGANISGILTGHGTLIALLLFVGALIVGFYFKYRREPIANKAIQGNIQRVNFLILFLKTLSYSWLITPLFVDAGSMGGIRVPVPGIFFLIPIFGQIAAFTTFVAHPGLLFGLWIIFALYMTLMIILSRKVSEKKVIRMFFVIAMIALYWMLAKVILPGLVH